ncbi:MAG TPA: lactonase family protein [Terriglobales bacterium]|nr:lactonase family protein [Terriglobales bacterium]
MTRIIGLLVLAFPILAMSATRDTQKGDYLLFVGTYTAKDSKGIYAYRLESSSKKMTPLGLVAETPNPSFLATDPTGRFLYAVNEVEKYKGEASGSVSAFAIDRTSGKLSRLNELSSRGTDPCYLSLDQSGKHLLVANYGSGSVAAFPIRKDGSLGDSSGFVQHAGSGPDRERQEGPHAHWIGVTPDNRFAMSADLGTDKVLVYRLDESNGSLSANDPAFVSLEPGSGPRHFDFHPNGRFAYVLSELKPTVTVFSYAAQSGTLKQLQSLVTIPENFSGTNHPAEIRVHPNGRFLFASNRGHDSIAVFSIDQKNGTLSPVGYFSTEGKKPRNFEIDPSGSRLFVANQESGNIVVFNIDKATGKLTPTGQVLHVDSPVCLKFMALRQRK